MKKYKTGLIIGKFCPLHRGHQYLIEKGMEKVEKLTVIVCHTKRYTIPAKIRVDWIKKLYPEADVRVIKHGPEMDSSSTDISQKWAEKVIGVLRFVPEAVFSSEEYGAVFAKHMGSEHVRVDMERKIVPISATQVREDPYKYWLYLPEIVRGYFGKRVVILGAESTGTTTLSQDLAKYYKTTWVPEYGRTYYEGKMYSVGAEKWTTEEFLHIAEMQNKSEEALGLKSNRVLICDTDSFATSIWHRRYTGRKTNRLETIVNQTKHDLYILTDTDIPFAQDGTRDGEHLRQWMHELFLKELSRTKRPFIVVSGNKKERLKQAVVKIDKLLSEEIKKYEFKS